MKVLNIRRRERQSRDFRDSLSEGYFDKSSILRKSES